MLWSLQFLLPTLGLMSHVTGTILMNGQVKLVDYPNTRIDASALSLTTYRADAAEISYHGRWDSQHTSWWS